MPILNRLARVVSKPLPRMLSPIAHAVVDYMTAGSFLVGAGFFWRRNRRAALAALLCGGAELAVSLLTDYRGGRRKIISLPAHREVDLGLAAMTATIPESLKLSGGSERSFFLLHGAVMSAVGELTQFPQRAERSVRNRRAA